MSHDDNNKIIGIFNDLKMKLARKKCDEFNTLKKLGNY